MRHSPTQQTASTPNRLEPLVILATLTVLDLIYLLLAWSSVNIVSSYGWTLFVILPFFFGITVGVLGHWMGYRALDRCLILAFAALGIAGLIALLIGFEGAICILMASPLILFLTVIGCWVGTKILPSSQRTRTLGTMLVLIPFLMAFEAAVELEPALFAVRTTVEVDAPPEVVWRHVVSFSEIPEPESWLFKTGLAYPLRARIEGSGVGAIRYCEFSTGPFVEPIEVWDEPRLLRFAVSDNPPPMREWNPFHEVHPPHLDNFLVSRRGQFLLEPLPDGRTRLEGTTWYQHGLWPATYWSWWSKAIIHRIHERVLDHVRQLAEANLHPATSELLRSHELTHLDAVPDGSG